MTIENTKNLKYSFSEMLESYKETGLKSVKEIFTEEASEEEFNNEVETAKKQSNGKIRKKIAAAAVQGVEIQKEETQIEEGSVQDELYAQHQELRKKSGLPHPDYYKELGKSYDIENDKERYAKQAEIRKKYNIKESKSDTILKNLRHKKMCEELSQIDEALGKDAEASSWINDFVHSDNPKFEGKTKKERIQMALGAYYNKHPEKQK